MCAGYVNKFKWIVAFLGFWHIQLQAAQILIPMDVAQKNHLKAYGMAYWCLTQNIEVYWLLNYRGGSFLIPSTPELLRKCALRGISTEQLSDAGKQTLLNEISNPEINQEAIKLEKAPKIAVYTPGGKQPWDDAVTLVLTYAEIPYDEVYDESVFQGQLKKYDWLHLHHEDFTGQYGKFYSGYAHTAWYQKEVFDNEAMAKKLGFNKVSKLKLHTAKTIREFVFSGGFLFAMCSATDSYDIALAAEGTDICESMYDHDAADPNAAEQLDFSKGFAFENYQLSNNPYEYEYSNIDTYTTRALKYPITQRNDRFMLFDFSAKWDPVPSMLCQNHENNLQAFWGQTAAFNKSVIKKNVLVMGESKAFNEARYIHGEYGQGTWTYYAGHDPEDYQHKVEDPPTDLTLHPNSPGYRLILNNILFPAAKKKKQKT